MPIQLQGFQSVKNSVDQGYERLDQAVKDTASDDVVPQAPKSFSASAMVERLRPDHARMHFIHGKCLDLPCKSLIYRFQTKRAHGGLSFL